MANARKKISELTTLTSASLDTLVVGVDNGTTYKIELDVLADAVTSRVNILDRDRLSSLESVTSSFETKGRNLISSSAQISSLGFISNSVDISSLNAFTSSQTTLNTAFTNGINSRLQTSSFNTFSASVHSEIIAATNEQSFNGLISGSSQLTSSYDSRYVISGSITQTTWDNISGKPDGLVSQSVDIADFVFTTDTITNSDVTIHATDGDIVLNADGNVYKGSATAGNQLLTTGYFGTVIGDENRINTGTGHSITDNLDNIINSIPSVTSLNNATSSYEIKGSGILSGSISYTSLTNIPIGIVSQSTDLSSLNQFTSSYNSDSSSFDSRITSLVTSGVPAGTVSGSSQLTASYDTRYTLSGSVQSVTLPSGLISGSSQLTASYDTRYALSASYLTSLNGAFSSSIQTLGGSGVWSGSAQLPVGVISGSSQLTTSLAQLNSNNSFVGNQEITGSLNITNGIFANSLTVTTFYAVSSSVSSTSGSTSFGSVNGDFMNVTGSIYATNAISAAAFIGLGNLQSYSSSVESKIIADRMRLTTLESVTSSYETKGRGIISGSSQLTSSYDNRYVISGSITQTTWDNIASKPSGIISGSSQLTSSFETIGRGIISSSTQLPSGLISGSSQLPVGIISGSSQLTASFDVRYALSGSGGSATIPAGTISGSSQLTSSYDGRYTLTSSFNSFTASAQAVTTGSNSFNGTQTITGSLIVTTGSFVGSTITANTSSLYLTSGSNMYVQNNGTVEITGSLLFSGSSATFNVPALIVNGRGGDEGGEINLAIPVTNTTLQNRVTTDVFQNRYRIFEGSANAKGVFVDLSKAPAGVGGELLWKASGLVNTGVDVILGDLKARIPSTGNKSLQLSTTTGVTYSVYGSGIYTQAGSTVGTTINASSPLSVTSTPAYLASGYNFGTAGATDTWVIMDTSNTIAWRITMILGSGFNNNMISIERLV